MIAVHAGAGFHSYSNASDYERLCKRACQEAWWLLDSGAKAADVVAKAVEILENDPSTNAGYGSNLTAAGRVECDASIMDGQTLNFAAVGCVSGIQNPVLVARQLLEEQNQGFATDAGLIVPCVLVGPAVQEWASKHGLGSQIIDEDLLVSDKAVGTFRKYMKRLGKGATTVDERLSKGKPDICNDKLSAKSDCVYATVEGKADDVPPPLDTVGAVCIDVRGQVASAVSSGGIVLKQPGRIGQAAMYGCGCWAESDASDEGVDVAASVTGCGEQIMKTLLAQRCSTSLSDGSRKANNSDEAEPAVTTLHSIFYRDFFDSRFLERIEKKMAGVLALVVSRCSTDAAPDSGGMSRSGELLWCHSTRSMAIGYMSSSGYKGSMAPQPRAFISRLGGSGSTVASGCVNEAEEKECEGRRCIVGGVSFRLR